MKAVVIGGTGAVGSSLITQLLSSPACESVRAVLRRELTGEGSGKLKQYVIDLDRLAQDASEAFAGADVCFCTIGTTRAVAGSAENFIKVDLEYVTAAAGAAKSAGVPHFSLLTAAGANASLPDVRWKLLHGVLYARCKGLAEQAVINQGFSHASIFRPGLIDRGASARSSEKLMTTPQDL
ncbi:hypothetical protein WJX73_006917 [Symbiochloris irregularis]|uniref:NAD(P)-binding domain-containing protein n=1 Tax=Symbiochloris irregularis TaxID=706552 RepID=A0AAW1NRT3_9CHLO